MKKRVILFVSFLTIFNVLCIKDVRANDEEPYGVVCQYYQSYRSQSTTRDEKVSVRKMTGINDTGTEQSESFSASREVSFVGNVSVSAERELILATVGGTVEVSYGVSTTEVHTVNMVIPPYTTYHVEIGSYKTTTYGYIQTTYTDCSTSTSSLKNLKYTTRPYAYWYE